MTIPILHLNSITQRFGGITALSHFSLSLAPDTVTGLIGPNGAGKTTVFNLITGIYTPSSGTITFNDFDITGLAPYKIARLGISRTFQNIRLFHDMTCIDNLKAAGTTRVEYGIWASLFHTPSFYRDEHRLDDYCYDLLKRFDLHRYAYQPASSLPYGKQRRLEIARALASSPRILLLDEPAAGMNPAETRGLMDILHRIHEEFDLTLLIIEHNMQLIMNVCDSIAVLDFGETIAQGTPHDIRSNPAVLSAYLGKQEHHAS
jgi:branched-chain amino acid transport system ATP-binding protein